MHMKEDQCSSHSGMFKDIYWYLGVLLALWISFKILLSLWRGLYSCVLGDLLGHTVNWRNAGTWAVVTGATDGIGREYAMQLAAKGFDIVLISRTEEKLKNVAKDIGIKYDVKTRTVAIDVVGDLSKYEDVRKALEDIEVGVLVNNVGMSYRHPEYLTLIENGEKCAEDLIKANILSTTKMTQIVLPQMESRKRGIIINISSLSAAMPMPLLSIYSSCKAYVNFFTKATQEEYKARGIIIQSVLPGFVSTNMSKMRPSFMVCTASAFVYWALKTVGIEDTTYGYPTHKLHGYFQELMVQYLPESVNLAFHHRILSGMRAKCYRKLGLVERDAEKSE